MPGWNGQDHADVVARAKAQLVAAGADLSGVCGAFKITNFAAWLLKDEGAGLLAKTTGTNCLGRAVDIVAYPNGMLFDALVDKFGAQTPAWQMQAGLADPSRWLAPTDPALDMPPLTPPAPPRPAPPYDLGAFIDRVDAAFAAIQAQAAENTARIQQQIDQAIHNAERSAAPIVALLERLPK